MDSLRSRSLGESGSSRKRQIVQDVQALKGKILLFCWKLLVNCWRTPDHVCCPGANGRKLGKRSGRRRTSPGLPALALRIFWDSLFEHMQRNPGMLSRMNNWMEPWAILAMTWMVMWWMFEQALAWSAEESRRKVLVLSREVEEEEEEKMSDLTSRVVLAVAAGEEDWPARLREALRSRVGTAGGRGGAFLCCAAPVDEADNEVRRRKDGEGDVAVVECYRDDVERGGRGRQKVLDCPSWDVYTVSI